MLNAFLGAFGIILLVCIVIAALGSMAAGSKKKSSNRSGSHIAPNIKMEFIPDNNVWGPTPEQERHRHTCDPKRKSRIVSVFTKKWFDVAAESFIVIDIETTGLSNIIDHIVEIAAIRYEGGMERETFSTLVKPPIVMSDEVIGIHHITNEMVEDAPTIEEVMPELLDFVGDSLLVGHNVNFDVGFIEIDARQLGYDPCWSYVDTISVAKKIIPGLPNYKQATVVNALGIRQSIAHRAEEDCRACAEIIIKALQRLAQGEKF